MTKKTLGFLTLCLALLAPATSNAEGGPGAIDAFRKADAGISVLVTEDGAKQQLRARTDALLDYRSVAIEALGGSEQFESRCGSRCPEFVEQLAKVIRHDHLRNVEARQKGAVEYLGEKVGKSVTVVRTRATVTVGKTTQTQKTDYVMHKVDRAWKVRDIVIDGVSLTATYRAEFTKLADADGIVAVLTELDARLKQARVRR